MNNSIKLRRDAVRILQAVVQGRSLSTVLPQYQSRYEQKDAALLAELAQGLCRYYFALQKQVKAYLQRPLKPKDQVLLYLIMLGAYQLQKTRIPAHAAINSTVAACAALNKAWAKGLVNALLRRMQREQPPLAAISLPDWLWQTIQDAYPQSAAQIAASFLHKPSMIIRVNQQKISRTDYARLLMEQGQTSRPIQNIPSALRLDQPVHPHQLPYFEQGYCSVQDAGAQLAGFLWSIPDGAEVLDACAAPGGKTGHLLERNPRIKLTAVDIDASRLQKVEQNLKRLGYANQVKLKVADMSQAAAWSQSYDYILLDVPCSATGVIRRHPDIALLRRAADLTALIEQQQNMIQLAWSRLRRGGYLLYATCSILPAENQHQIAAFLQQQADAHLLSLSEHNDPAELDLQLLPLSLDHDGFYYALLQKK